jgi:hypothetical protein
MMVALPMLKRNFFERFLNSKNSINEFGLQDLTYHRSIQKKWSLI